MTKAPISLQDLRRKLYVRTKVDLAWRFWGLYVHVCKHETLQEAYRLAKAKNGTPAFNGVTFEAIETEGLEVFINLDLRSYFDTVRHHIVLKSFVSRIHGSVQAQATFQVHDIKLFPVFPET